MVAGNSRAAGESIDGARPADSFFTLIRSSFEGAPSGMAIVSTDATFLRVNPSLCSLLGLSRTELLKMKWRDVVHPDDVGTEAGLGARYEADASGFVTTEARLVRPDGTGLWALLSICSIVDEHERPAAYFLQVFDITEHKLGEESLTQYATSVELLKRVATQANEAESIDDVLQASVAEVCHYLGWPAGHALLLSAGAPARLDPAGVWWLRDPERFSDFVAVTNRSRFGPGEGIPGMVLESGRPMWVADLAQIQGLARGDAARVAGIRCAFAFPVLVGTDVVGVLEFFSYTQFPPDEMLMEVAAQIGTQLGRVVERSRSEAALRAGELRNRLILDTASDAFVEIDEQGTVVTWNRQAEISFGWTAEEIIGRRLSETIIPPEHRRAHEEGLRTFLATGAGPILHRRIEINAVRKSGEEFPVELTVWPVRMGAGWTFSAFLRDITERVRMREDLLRLSSIDELTGLKNRRAFLEAAVPQLNVARRIGHRLTLLFIDLDRMKEINDSLGHLQGDRALIDAASILSSTFRESDLIGRVGGDEFCVLLLGTSEEAEISLKRLQQAVEAHNQTAHRPFHMSLSVGATMFDPEHPYSIEQLMDRADRSMYEHKARHEGGEPRT